MTASNHPPIRYSHVAIGCTNFERSLRFYRALGFEVHLQRVEKTAAMDQAMTAPQGTGDRHIAYMRAGSGSEIQFLSLAHRPGFAGIPPKLDDIGINHFSVWVEDLDAALQALEETGAKRVMDPFVGEGIGWTLPEEFQVRSVFVEDPDGILVQLDQALQGADLVPDSEVSR